MKSRYFSDKPVQKLHLSALDYTRTIVSGKWKLRIICTLMQGKNRFTDIELAWPSISARMLSIELKELEMNGIVIRKEADISHGRYVYELTETGKGLFQIIDKMVDWGLKQRK
ncbi:MAG TPA: helix-turn-helix domain-containing protein [Chitinophagaceae bacterium]|jgi:DNA-binding HxlR family transcriptional regulator|nr:helix-turn-helix domain-containing protein [Chitinophagaceae bacterium]